MKSRTFLIGGWCLCLALLIVSSTTGQAVRSKWDDGIPTDLLPKAKGFERTDLFSFSNDSLPHEAPTPQQVAMIAKLKMVYEARKGIRERDPAKVSADNLSRLSLTWFKAEVDAAVSGPQAIKAASEYLEREGMSVGK
jgi:hypothetical protein